ncbi:MAG: hypothetical protein J6H21_02370 [Firmicutes bacterium]|nr:hypothetical protein [Bacillota bacterium]
MEKKKSLETEIKELISWNEVGVGMAIKMCRENGISPKRFGELVKMGMNTETVKVNDDRTDIITYLYDREIRREDAAVIRKRVNNRRRKERVSRRHGGRPKSHIRVDWESKG